MLGKKAAHDGKENFASSGPGLGLRKDLAGLWWQLQYILFMSVYS